MGAFIMVFEAWLSLESGEYSDDDTPAILVDYYPPLTSEGKPNELSQCNRIFI